jgi:hypothetical protein
LIYLTMCRAQVTTHRKLTLGLFTSMRPDAVIEARRAS